MKKIILQYDATFEKEEDGGYSVWVPSLPGCASQGNTLAEAIKNIEQAISLYLEDADDKQLSKGNQSTKRFKIPVQITTG